MAGAGSGNVSVQTAGVTAAVCGTGATGGLTGSGFASGFGRVSCARRGFAFASAAPSSGPVFVYKPPIVTDFLNVNEKTKTIAGVSGVTPGMHTECVSVKIT
ncbi:hypothetical protein B0H14DRAFT_3516366 [Mycena olivaceomarginata]|nr:hypothetical protein B0H14DRAFT_3516366 [Mycena olivaceomarginata]